MKDNFTAVARVGKLFGQADTGGVSVTLYTTFPEDFDPQNDALFVDINSLAVPLYCDKFERRGVSGANVEFADFDTPRRVEELIGKELYMELEEERDDDEFYMEDLIGFTAIVDKRKGTISDYYDNEANPLFEITLDDHQHLIPAAEEFIAHIDFERRRQEDLSIDDKFSAPAASTPSPEESLISMQQRTQIEHYINCLPEHYRRLFTMRFLEDYSYDEISEKLHLPMGTVKTQIHRARERMCNLILEGEKDKI